MNTPQITDTHVNPVAVFEYDKQLGVVSATSEDGLVVQADDEDGKASLQSFMEELMQKKQWTAIELVQNLPEYLTGVVHAQVVNNGGQDGSEEGN